jgi:16S rRNA U1498 N3-methylase RsmE
METSPDMITLGELQGKVVVCVPDGMSDPGDFDTVAIGPEGGFADTEIPPSASLWRLGSTVLRVETAAIVAAARAIVG